MFPIVSHTELPYDVNSFIDNLPLYADLSPTITDLIRMINESGNYMWVGYGLPVIQPRTLLNFGAYETQNGTIAMPPGSYVVALNGYSSLGSGNQYNFKAKIYDKGTKASIFYGDYALASTVMSDMDRGVSNPIQNEPFGPAYLTSPLIITPPGNFNWEIVNMSPESALIQVFASCAVPINNQSLNTRDIRK